MVKVVGIDPGEYGVKVVMLDGSYKKTRLVRSQIEPMPDEVAPGDRVEMVAETVRHALKEGHITIEDARLGYPCREAVLRTIEVPFSGREAIRRIIKSEVEGAIHSHSVDDMVVDFHEVGKVIDGSRVLVAAVPKSGLRVLLQALEKKSIEPEHVDLDTMALYRVAHWCGAFHASAAAAAEEVMALDEDGEPTLPAPLPVPVIAPGIQRTISAVLDLGARSTRVILVENGNLVEMRTLRVGDSAIVDEVARTHGLSSSQAREIMTASLATGADQHVEAAELSVAPVGEPVEGEAAAPLRQVTVPYADVENAQTTLLQRLAREFARFLVSVGDRAKIETLWITGGASQLQGMREMLKEVFGVDPRQLDVMGRLQHSLTPEEAESTGPRLSIAIGLALGGLGGPAGFNLRQEDLVFTRGFDRVKFPLAITCMVALFAMVVWGVKLNNDLKNLEFQIGRTYIAPDGKSKEPSFYGMLLATFPGGWFNDTTKFPREKYNALLQELVAAPVAQRLNIVRGTLSKEVERQQKEFGIFEDLSLDSGLAVLVRFSDMMERHKSDMGRFLVTRINLSLGNNSGTRYLEVVVAFRGSDFRSVNRREFEAAIVEECGRPDSPFTDPDGKSHNVKEESFSDSKESGVEGAYCTARLAIKEHFEPFQ